MDVVDALDTACHTQTARSVIMGGTSNSKLRAIFRPSSNIDLYSLQRSSTPGGFADKMASPEPLEPRVSAFDVLGFTDQSPGLGLFDEGYAGLWLETTDKVRQGETPWSFITASPLPWM